MLPSIAGSQWITSQKRKESGRTDPNKLIFLTYAQSDMRVKINSVPSVWKELLFEDAQTEWSYKHIWQVEARQVSVGNIISQDLPVITRVLLTSSVSAEAVAVSIMISNCLLLVEATVTYGFKKLEKCSYRNKLSRIIKTGWTQNNFPLQLTS